MELWLQGRATPDTALRQGFRRSPLRYTGMLGGEPVCMFGVSPYSIMMGQGVPWLVGANGLSSWSAQKALLRLAPPAIDAMHRGFPMLINAVHDENASAKRWLQWLGFTLLDPAPMGLGGAMFRPFYRTRDDV